VSTATVVFGGATSKLTDWAAAAAQALGLSKNQAMKAALTFSTYGKIIGLTGSDLANFSTDLTGVAADLGAFANLPTEQAINAIGSALKNERDPLEAFGVILTDAEVRAALFRKTGEKVTGALSAQQNVVGTLAAIHEKAADKVGAFARENDELGNKTQRNGAEFENLKTSIGEVFLPVAVTAQEWISSTLLPTLREWGGVLRDDVVPAVEGAAQSMGEKLQPALDLLGSWWDESGAPGLTNFWSFLVDDLWPALQDGWAWLATKLAPAIDFLRSRFEELRPELEKAWVSFQKLWDQLKKLWDAAFPLTQLLALLAGSAVLGALIVAVQGTLEIIRLASDAMQVWAWLIDNVVEPQITGLIKVWDTLWDAVERVYKMFQKVKDLVSGDWLGNIGKGIGGFLDGLPGIGRSAGGGPSAGGLATGAGGGYVYAPVYNVTATVPPGVFAGDVGAAIVDALRRHEARTGPLPLRIVGGG
jgi:DNA-binding HxlR family transcriptional regulator